MAKLEAIGDHQNDVNLSLELHDRAKNEGEKETLRTYLLSGISNTSQGPVYSPAESGEEIMTGPPSARYETVNGLPVTGNRRDHHSKRPGFFDLETTL